MRNATLTQLSIREGRELAAQYPASHGERCLDSSPAIDAGTNNHYICTREHGHDGPHVGHGPDLTAAATWPATTKMCPDCGGTMTKEEGAIGEWVITTQCQKEWRTRPGVYWACGGCENCEEVGCA